MMMRISTHAQTWNEIHVAVVHGMDISGRPQHANAIPQQHLQFQFEDVAGALIKVSSYQLGLLSYVLFLHPYLQYGHSVAP